MNAGNNGGYQEKVADIKKPKQCPLKLKKVTIEHLHKKTAFK